MKILPLPAWIVNCDPQNQTHQNLAEEGEMGSEEGAREGDEVGTEILNGEGRAGDEESYVLEFPLLPCYPAKN